MSDEMKVRFLVNKASRKILYMEAGKDFVDLLLGFLQLPVASILSVFAEGEAGAGMQVGSISNVYASLRKLSNSSFLVSKDSLIHPPAPLQLSKESPKLLLPAAASVAVEALPDVIYTCSRNHHTYASWVSGANCPSCGYANYNLTQGMSVVKDSVPNPAPARASVSDYKGYVKDYLSFIVTDDLCIMPASTIESVVLLNKLHVEKLSDLDSQEASVTAPEALELLKVSFTTQSSLNHVFSTRVMKSID